jgi:2-alkyl-3-oxoalkanoate reductase
MRILIAGASGAIGRPLVRRLRANQHEVFALARSPDSAPALKDIGVEPVSARTFMELEARASATPGLEFVALRYGFFYGPGTWYTREGDMGDQLRQQQVPIIGEGQGVYSFVHIDDAAGATAAALECPPGAYNIVDANPSPQHVWLTAFARAAGAPAPPRVSEEEALRALGPDAVYYATRLRGASNEKAGRELEFRPRPLEWILDPYR